jgi:RimJ/RimL family protein N-acetyltransferase
MYERETSPVRKLLIGSRIRLAAIRECDYDDLADWYSDAHALRYYEMEPAFPYNRDKIKAWLNNQVDTGNQYSFGIRRLNDDKLLGYVDINSILWSNGVGTLSIALGDKDSRGKGYASEALKLILYFAFCELNLFRVQLSVISYNTSAIALYERCGFVREGCQRQFISRDCKRFDLYNYGLLRDEWMNFKEK